MKDAEESVEISLFFKYICEIYPIFRKILTIRFIYIFSKFQSPSPLFPTFVSSLGSAPDPWQTFASSLGSLPYLRQTFASSLQYLARPSEVKPPSASFLQPAVRFH